MNIVTNKQAFLFLCNLPSKSALSTFKKICSSTESIHDHTTLLYHLKERIVPKNIEKLQCFCFTDDILYELGYNPLGPKLTPGNNHFPLLKFFREFPDYDYYWCIEDDVRFVGDWKFLFTNFNEVKDDFISTHVQRHKDEPQWFWWNSLMHHNYTIPDNKKLKSFNPIYRISREALIYIDKALKDGWYGHHEVLFPTLLETAGFEISDFGGEGEFVRKDNQSKFYIGDYKNSFGIDNRMATFRWRPIFSEVGDLKNMLYHPVKD
ncbi:DUF3405 domain-containing protein [Galbibacter sp. EGI 63066]|uniref:DUF3405 domain-containing protein n=1 Tax=Galbibacter sp. EGI 63066 TaxID=2993559 RepID=UPI00224907E7|nr:DUF3405 domain-containing protein [Galbibacter sp. EGI 63066]MCX2678487.1 DUF3405 domain-containing protein [Galbibacter sp. EGI 63066]